MKKLAVFFCLMVLAATSVWLLNSKERGNVAYVTFPRGERIEVDVANDPAERAQGLSGRDGLEPGTGMLFDFGGAVSSPGIWMKDMRFPIDILWILNDEIVWIEHNAPVPQGEFIASFFPPVEATHVLELPAGFVRTYGLSLGDVVSVHADN